MHTLTYFHLWCSADFNQQFTEAVVEPNRDWGGNYGFFFSTRRAVSITPSRSV